MPRNPFILLENFFAGREQKWEKPNGKDDGCTGGAGHNVSDSDGNEDTIMCGVQSTQKTLTTPSRSHELSLRLANRPE